MLSKAKFSLKKIDSQCKTIRPAFWQSGNKTARAVKLSTERDIVDSARKGVMKKVQRRPWCQD